MGSRFSTPIPFKLVLLVSCELGVRAAQVVTLVWFSLSQLVFPFLYNRQHMVTMLTSRWELDFTDHNYELARRKLNIKSP